MKLIILPAALLFAAPAFAGTVIPLGNFSGVEASDGAKVIIRHGGAQQVDMVRGSTDYTRFEVRDNTLHITTCANSWHCPHHYELEVDITMPAIASISASDGADIETQGAFPGQGRLAVHASDGGDIDARAINAANVEASASDGGNIRVSAQKTLNAKADDGGNIEYWGNPSVNMRAEDGGNISQGS